MQQIYYPVQLYQAPKLSQQHAEPTAAEFEQLGRRLYALTLRKRELARQQAQVNSDMDQAVNEMRRKASPDLVEECSNCHLRHEGNC